MDNKFEAIAAGALKATMEEAGIEMSDFYVQTRGDVLAIMAEVPKSKARKAADAMLANIDTAPDHAVILEDVDNGTRVYCEIRVTDADKMSHAAMLAKKYLAKGGEETYTLEELADMDTDSWVEAMSNMADEYGTEIEGYKDVLAHEDEESDEWDTDLCPAEWDEEFMEFAEKRQLRFTKDGALAV